MKLFSMKTGCKKRRRTYRSREIMVKQKKHSRLGIFFFCLNESCCSVMLNIYHKSEKHKSDPERGAGALDDDDDGQWTAQIKKTNHRKKKTQSLRSWSFICWSSLFTPSPRSIVIRRAVRFFFLSQCFIVAESTPSIVEEGWMRSNCDCRKNFVIFFPPHHSA